MDPWEQALHELPKLSVASGSGRLRRWLLALPPLPADHLRSLDAAQQWRAYMVLSFLAHAYMWCELDDEVPQVLPAALAVPWAAAARAVDMPPVLVYATYNLLNWRRLDPAGPIELGNIVCLNNFLGGVDEEWFRLIHVEIEARAAPAIAALQPMQRAALQGNEAGVVSGLQAVCVALQAMQATLARMSEKCDPHVYYHRVRLPMSGWKGNPALPRGLVYEGVSAEPVQLFGETGAQSSIVPAFDAALGIEHESDWLKAYLAGMVPHMPPAHRAFLATLRQGPEAAGSSGGAGGSARGVRDVCRAAPKGSGLREAYNETVRELEGFRSQHKGFAYAYIARFSKQEKGTGGSDFMPALGGYRDTTAKHLL